MGWCEVSRGAGALPRPRKAAGSSGPAGIELTKPSLDTLHALSIREWQPPVLGIKSFPKQLHHTRGVEGEA